MHVRYWRRGSIKVISYLVTHEVLTLREIKPFKVRSLSKSLVSPSTPCCSIPVRDDTLAWSGEGETVAWYHTADNE